MHFHGVLDKDKQKFSISVGDRGIISEDVRLQMTCDTLHYCSCCRRFDVIVLNN